MLELKFAIYHGAASLSTQASDAVLGEESLTGPGLCTCLHGKKKWRHKGSHSSLVIGSKHLVRLQTWKKTMDWCTAQWKMLLFCVKTIAKESRNLD